METLRTDMLQIRLVTDTDGRVKRTGASRSEGAGTAKDAAQPTTTEPGDVEADAAKEEQAPAELNVDHGTGARASTPIDMCSTYSTSASATLHHTSNSVSLQYCLSLSSTACLSPVLPVSLQYCMSLTSTACLPPVLSVSLQYCVSLSRTPCLSPVHSLSLCVTLYLSISQKRL